MQTRRDVGNSPAVGGRYRSVLSKKVSKHPSFLARLPAFWAVALLVLLASVMPAVAPLAADAAPNPGNVRCRGQLATHVFGAHPNGGTYNATGGDDVIVITSGPVRVAAGSGADLICVKGAAHNRANKVTVLGQAGRDRIFVEAEVNTRIQGGAGRDLIIGSKLGYDRIDAGGAIDRCANGQNTTRCETNYHPSGLVKCADPSCLHPMIDDAANRINAISIRYLPDENNDGQIDTATTGYTGSVGQLRNKINANETANAWYATEATRYKGYERPNAKPSIGFEVVKKIEYRTNPPRGLPLRNGFFRPDYRSILNGIGICHQVDNLGVQEVWMHTQHHWLIEPAESNMSSPVGDYSNSEGTDDLPACNRSYVVYNFNFTRGTAEMMHNRGHQIEQQFGHDFELFWNKFVGTPGWFEPVSSPYRCGWTHYPPNATADYDYMDAAVVQSDCESWTPQGGARSATSCATWFNHLYGSPTCWSDGGLAFQVWWSQNIPGANNQLSYQGIPLINWWKVMADFDSLMFESDWLR